MVEELQRNSFLSSVYPLPLLSLSDFAAGYVTVEVHLPKAEREREREEPSLIYIIFHSDDIYQISFL